MGKVLRFLNLKPRDRQLFVYTYVLLSFIRFGFRLFRFTQLQNILRHMSRHSVNIPPTYSVLTLVWAVDAASSAMPGGVKCLARALTMDVLMRHQGYLPELRIGVIKDQEGQPQFHAWLEYQGQVVIGHLPNLMEFKTLSPPKSHPQVQS
jgi:Transglutaminase-like superfamily